jgi:heat shock 70kDa protein 4
VTNTFTGMKLLVGRQFDDADVQRELSRFPFKAVKMPHGGVGVAVWYNDEEIIVSVEHLMAMMLVKGKEISTNASAGVSLADSVLAVPHWYTDAQRRGILHACEIASLNCLKVTNESNAIALSYGIFKSAKKLFSETEPTHIMFVDLGYSGYCVTVVDFIQEKMNVRSTVCDREVSGRDFDDVIIEFLAETFQKKTGIDVRRNKKAVLKLQAAAEKAKKTLSPSGVTEASVSVECLAEDIDLNVILTRDEFESRAQKLVQRLPVAVHKALQEAGLSREQLSEIEIVGGSSRINIVKRVLGEALGLDASAMNFGLKTTMNADEAVARGAALQCAMLSSRMKVKPFSIIDRVTYGIVAQFDNGDAAVDEAKGTTVALYQRGDELPHKPRRITFRNKTHDFSITCAYDDQSVDILPAGESRFIGKFTVKVPANTAPSDVRVTFNLDKHGLLHVQSAQLMEEVSAEEAAKAAAEEAKNNTNAASNEEGKDDKKKYRKVDLQVVSEFPGLTREQIKTAIELEASMALEDKLIVETADKRNELESYIYAMRDKLDGVLRDFTAASEKQQFKDKINSAEDWLYNEGFDTTKQQYAKKIEELRAVGDKIEHRYNENTHRPGVAKSLRDQVEMCRKFAANYDEAHAHITDDERDRVRAAADEAERWLHDMLEKQGALSLSADPALTCEAIQNKRKTLFNTTNPIMIKPKPAPAPAPAPEPAKDAKHEESKAEHKDESVPMDQAKGGPEEDAKEAK